MTLAKVKNDAGSKVVCSCGCGSRGRCFIYGDDVPTGLELVYARAMNRRLSL